MTDRPLLEVADLGKDFHLGGGLFGGGRTVRAVDGLDFTMARGETLGLVGESGCGKSTTGRLLLRLIDPSRGTIRFDGTDITRLTGPALRRRRRDMQIIFQDPFGSLNPRFTIEEIVTDPLRVHGADRATRERRARRLLDLVGLPAYLAGRYPHEFSGGQRQRIGIARALALDPKFIVCDEPLSALDVSIQAQIINLLVDLRRELNLTYLFIAHDLAVVKHISSTIAVMYLGGIVEYGATADVFASPAHPYARALLSAIPSPRTRRPERIILKGDLPSPLSPPPGCRFHTRCPQAHARCAAERPRRHPRADGGWVACHLFDPARPAAAMIAETTP